MKILIAGGTAPFAGWLAAQLLRDGHTVRVTAASPPAAPLPPGAEFVHCGLGHDEEYALGEAVWFGVEQIVLLTNCMHGLRWRRAPGRRLARPRHPRRLQPPVRRLRSRGPACGRRQLPRRL